MELPGCNNNLNFTPCCLSAKGSLEPWHKLASVHWADRWVPRPPPIDQGQLLGMQGYSACVKLHKHPSFLHQDWTENSKRMFFSLSLLVVWCWPFKKTLFFFMRILDNQLEHSTLQIYIYLKKRYIFSAGNPLCFCLIIISLEEKGNTCVLICCIVGVLQKKKKSFELKQCKADSFGCSYYANQISQFFKRNIQAHKQFCKHALNLDQNNIYSPTVTHLHIHNSRL